MGLPHLEGGEAFAWITLSSGVQPPWCNHAQSQPLCTWLLSSLGLGTACPSVLLLGPVRISGFPGNRKHVSSLGTPSQSWCCGCRGDPAALLAGPWQVRGDGVEIPKSSVRLARSHALKAHSQAKLLCWFWGGEASLGALKPHPVYAESSFCRAPGGLGIPEVLSLLVSLRLGLTVALR